MNLYPAFAYLRHRLKAKGTAGHGVHSPFVYNFLTTVVRGVTPAGQVYAAEKVRKSMLADRRFIEVTDLGTGSVTGKGNRRRVCDIARIAALPQRQDALLLRMAAAECGDPAADTGAVIELGTSLGISTLYLAAAAPHNDIYTVEGCPLLAGIAEENFKNQQLENVAVMNMDFSNALEILKERGVKIRLAFIDGNHKGEALESYFELLMGMSGERMTVIADDIHLNRSMYDAWKTISSDKRVQVSIETKRFGVLFKRKAVTPGAYRIWC